MRLAWRRADAAYPLVRAIAPEVSLDGWLDYVERRCREGGLMGLFGEDGVLVGLFSHRFGERLPRARAGARRLCYLRTQPCGWKPR
jgi:hypothetical protein